MSYPFEIPRFGVQGGGKKRELVMPVHKPAPWCAPVAQTAHWYYHIRENGVIKADCFFVASDKEGAEAQADLTRRANPGFEITFAYKS